MLAVTSVNAKSRALIATRKFLAKNLTSHPILVPSDTGLSSPSCETMTFFDRIEEIRIDSRAIYYVGGSVDTSLQRQKGGYSKLDFTNKVHEVP